VPLSAGRHADTHTSIWIYILPGQHARITLVFLHLQHLEATYSCCVVSDCNTLTLAAECVQMLLALFKQFLPKQVMQLLPALHHHQ
jgi:hypothetical protein